MAYNLYIVGGGGFGREVLSWLQDLPEWEQGWKFQGFLDDNLDALNGYDCGYSVVAPVSGYRPLPEDRLVCGIGAVPLKRLVCEPLVESGAQFISVVHPTAVIGARVVLGDGVVICPRVTLTCDIKIGAMSMLNCHSSVGHDAVIGAWTTISAHCDLTGHTRLGESVFLGSGARIIPGKKVGDSSVVGAGAVVIRSVGEGVTVFGNPAKVIA